MSTVSKQDLWRDIKLAGAHLLWAEAVHGGRDTFAASCALDHAQDDFGRLLDAWVAAVTADQTAADAEQVLAGVAEDEPPTTFAQNSSMPKPPTGTVIKAGRIT